jgi:prolipoprotein diacylglyceryl transferase
MYLLQINWDINPEIFRIGSFALRYYSLAFLLAFSLGWYLMHRIYSEENLGEKELDKLFMYAVISTLLGARIGHYLFYEPFEVFLQRPLEIILPVSFTPSFRFTGFSGLASHGAVLGLLIAFYFYSKNIIKKPFLFILDRVVVPISLGAAFVRIGNFFNSEIIGKATNADHGVIFSRLGENFPRHPAQLYESIGYAIILFIIWYIYWKTNRAKQPGFLFGLCFVLMWTVRFFVEFYKEPQVNERADWLLNTGQLLSIPFILVGAYFVFNATRNKIAS